VKKTSGNMPARQLFKAIFTVAGRELLPNIFIQSPLLTKSFYRLVLAYGPSGYNKDVTHTYVFRTYDHPHPSPWAPESKRKRHLNPGNATADEIWKVARATSAAPKYFDPITIGERMFRDGAIGANNPVR
jgi:hypothetical protein